MEKTTTQKLSQKTEITVVDQDGQILRHEVERVFKAKKDTEPAYVKLYLENITKVTDLKRGSIDVLIKLIELVEYNTNKVVLTPTHRKIIAKSLSIEMGSLSNSLTDLKKSGILQDVDKGIFLLNPNILAKGEWSKIKHIRTSISENNQIDNQY